MVTYRNIVICWGKNKNLQILNKLYKIIAVSYKWWVNGSETDIYTDNIVRISTTEDKK